MERTVEPIGALRWELVDGPDVPGRLRADIDQALGRGEPVSLKAMHVILDDTTRPIINLLGEAAAEDRAQANRIDIQADAYSLNYALLPEHRTQIPELRETFEALGQLGVQAAFTNNYVGPLHRGLLKETLRDHRKGFTAGDAVWLGSCNFHAENFDAADISDFMVRVENPALAKLVRYIFRRDVRQRRPSGDFGVQLDGSNHLLLDGGMPLRSNIMRAVCQLAGDTDLGSGRSLFTSQYYPAREVARLLRRDANAVAAFNNAHELEARGQGLTSKLMGMIESVGPDLQGRARRSAYVHAKSLAVPVRPNQARGPLFPTHEGRIGVMGSHNMTRLGVLAGTREMMLVTTDTSLLDQHADWVHAKFG